MSTEAILQVRGLSKQYGSVRAVEDLSLEMQRGEVLALLGPNGSGKTTTIRSVAGLLRPSAGSIVVDGCDLRRDYRRARKRFSYLPQQARFAPTLTVQEVCTFHAQLRLIDPQRALQALKEVGLEGDALGRQVGQLSGGMRQRLAWAVAILGDNELLLLDEPTANLDPAGALDFRRMAKRWRSEGRSLLLCTHFLTDVEQLADRVLILVEGRAVAQQSIGELRLRLSQYSRLRVDVGDATPAHFSAALEAGALDARQNGHGIVITAPEARRMDVLSSLRSVGAIRHFETEQPSLEDVYLDYVRGASYEQD
jgi:ABC-type multidrug transport system ATPase subunit